MRGDTMQRHDNYLLLWGGVDIHPAIYGEKFHPKTQNPNIKRDTEEISAVKEYMRKGLPIFGVCRGAQLLCALNGGKLFQHTNDHGVSHDIYVDDQLGGIEVMRKVAAGHHQMMRPSGKYVVYGFDGRSSLAYDSDNNLHHVEKAPEIVWWEDTKCLAIQPHPEWMPHDYPFNMWLNKLIVNLTNIEGVF
jgi:gamma-glutamyl-gamma-aminobutyrate hydrolase PuuD